MQDRRTDERNDERYEEARETQRTPSGAPAEAEAGDDGRNIAINRIVEAASAAGVSFEEMARMIAEAAGMSEEQVRESPLDGPGRLEDSDARTPLGEGNVRDANRGEQPDIDEAAPEGDAIEGGPGR